MTDKQPRRDGNIKGNSEKSEKLGVFEMKSSFSKDIKRGGGEGRRKSLTVCMSLNVPVSKTRKESSRPNNKEMITQ